MKFAFVHAHTRVFGVRDMCRVLEVSASGYYRWRRDPVGRRGVKRAELAAAIRSVHEQSRRVYGSPRVHRALVALGRRVCRNTVARVMKTHGIKARTHRRFRVRTTDSRHDHPIAPNLLDRRFQAQRKDQVWLTDVTYIPSDEGFVFLAGVMDLYSRRIVGWSMSDSLRAKLTVDALNMALRTRRPDAGLLHHSDRGVQYACAQYRGILRRRGITISMSRVGNCYDNAPQESLWGKLKQELVHGRRFATRTQARAAVFEWIEVFYNRQRLHSALGYVSPERFEAMTVGK